MTKSAAHPVRIGRRWVFPCGTTLPVVAGGDDTADPAEPETIEVPEDLTDRDALPDEQLVGIEEALVAAFDKLVEDGSTDLAALNALAESIESVRTEQTRRAGEDEKDRAEVEALAARIHPKAEADDDPEDPADPDPVEDPDPEAAADPDPAADPEPVKEPVTAAAPTPKRTAAAPSASGVRRHAKAPVAPKPSNENLVTITAAAEVPGFANSAKMQVGDLAQAMHDKARGLGNHSGRQPIARITRPAPTFEGNDPSVLLDSLVAATAPNARSLVSAGGWCRPADTFLDLFSIEGTDAMFDLPTIGISGSGVMVPSFIGFNAADQALWTWTAANDENVCTGIGNVVLAGNVVTIDTDDPHGLAPGDTVTLSGITTAAFIDLNGQTVTVATVTDADTFTFAFTHADMTTGASDGMICVSKPCMRIPCPTWTEYELEAEGLCITHGNLTNRAWPALGTRYVNLALAAHERRMRRLAFGKVLATIAGGDTITITSQDSDSAGEVLGAVDLGAIAYREQYGMGINAVLESVFPLWTREVIRAGLARRAGVDMLDVDNARITRWFTDRNVRPQFIRDWQPLIAGGVLPLVWPATVQFMLYPAGGYFLGTGGEIDLGVQRDSILNATNDFTLAWMEEFYLVGQRGPDGRLVTAALDPDGVTACCTAAPG